MIYKNEEITQVKSKHSFSGMIIKLIIIVLVIVFALAVYSTFLIIASLSSEEKDYIYDMKAYLIESSSMEPELCTGDVVIVKKINNINDIKKDDIITFKNRGEVITHRISSINNITGKITTKGDKNLTDDIEPINVEDIFGKKVFKISKFSIVEKIVRNVSFWLVIIIIVITIFLKSRKLSRKRMLRRKKKKQEDQSE